MWLVAHGTLHTHISRSGLDTSFLTKSYVKYNTNLCLEHNHPVNEFKIDGYIEIKNEADITESEVNMIRTLSLIHTKIPSIQNALRTEFSSEKKIYNSQLLHTMKKFQDERFGKDHYMICELMKLGNNAKNSGGEWQTDVNDTYQIIGKRFQSHCQKQYAL
eukprot:CCRYP_009557-RA/>CCRYP_009557-RA protein AED:0.36 eAED:0.46 QI:0/0/0/1/0/0/2/0/160